MNERQTCRDCARDAHYHGYCQPHYLRTLQSTFDGLMAIETDRCVIWPFGRNDRGYATWGRKDGRTGMLARRVCEDRHGPPPSDGHQSAHSCGNGNLGCINPRHLSWKTPTENGADREAHGTKLVGEAIPVAVLTERDVLAIRRAAADRVGQRQIAAQFGITQTNVSLIVNHKTWRHVA